MYCRLKNVYWHLKTSRSELIVITIQEMSTASSPFRSAPRRRHVYYNGLPQPFSGSFTRDKHTNTQNFNYTCIPNSEYAQRVISLMKTSVQGGPSITRSLQRPTEQPQPAHPLWPTQTSAWHTVGAADCIMVAKGLWGLQGKGQLPWV